VKAVPQSKNLIAGQNSDPEKQMYKQFSKDYDFGPNDPSKQLNATQKEDGESPQFTFKNKYLSKNDSVRQTR